MQATFQLLVDPKTPVQIIATMTLQEAEQLLKNMESDRWPNSSFKEILRQCILTASKSYASEHKVGDI